VAAPKASQLKVAARIVDASHHLLDRQMLDRDGTMCGKVDDLELTVPDEAPETGHLPVPYITAVLSGPAALAGRTGGILSRWLLAVQRRLHPAEDPEPARLPFQDVAEVGVAVRLGVSRDNVEANRLEWWARDNVIAKIPGSSHAAE
jgi:hypothetical protein